MKLISCNNCKRKKYLMKDEKIQKCPFCGDTFFQIYENKTIGTEEEIAKLNKTQSDFDKKLIFTKKIKTNKNDKKNKGGKKMDEKIEDSTKVVKQEAIKKISITTQVKDLLDKSTSTEDIIKTLGITNKRLLDIKWQLKNKK